MFDPTVSIHTVMILSNFTLGINDGSYTCGPLYITVSSKTALVMNWDFFSCSNHHIPDKIKIYGFKETSFEIIDDEVSPQDIMRGAYTSRLHFPRTISQFPGGWSKYGNRGIHTSHCLPYVIESSFKGWVIDRRCFRIYPSWMQNYGKIRIGNLMIPGTHNAGSYTGVAPYFKHYVLNQDRDLYEQLVFGQRYFDIRVGITPEDGRLYITHNIITTSFLDEALDNIARFVKKSPKEIIILDFHKFNLPVEFTKKDHYTVLKRIMKKLGNHLLPYYRGQSKKGPTLEELWRTKKSVIVAYENSEMVSENSMLWPDIKRYWGDKIHRDDLLQYIIQTMESTPKGNPMHVLMAELTPNAKYILQNPLKGIGYLADIINGEITYWIRDYNLSQEINLIASDFFLGNQLMEYAIEVNDLKLRSKKTILGFF